MGHDPDNPHEAITHLMSVILAIVILIIGIILFLSK